MNTALHYKIIHLALPLFFLFLVCFLYSSEAFADTEPESSSWFVFLSRLRFDDRIQGYIDLQPRVAIDASGANHDGDMRQFISRGAIGYDLTPKLTLFQGYAVSSQYEPKRIEHRSFQEVLAKTNTSIGDFVHRVRFEQRFFEKKRNVSLRGRYSLKYVLPVTNLLSFTTDNEVFFHMNDGDSGPQSGFDQNRFSLGVSHRLRDGVSLNLGYQNQFIERRGEQADTLNHALVLGLQTSLDLR